MRFYHYTKSTIDRHQRRPPAPRALNCCDAAAHLPGSDRRASSPPLTSTARRCPSPGSPLRLAAPARQRVAAPYITNCSTLRRTRGAKHLEVKCAAGYAVASSPVPYGTGIFLSPMKRPIETICKLKRSHRTY